MMCVIPAARATVIAARILAVARLALGVAAPNRAKMRTFLPAVRVDCAAHVTLHMVAVAVCRNRTALCEWHPIAPKRSKATLRNGESHGDPPALPRHPRCKRLSARRAWTRGRPRTASPPRGLAMRSVSAWGTTSTSGRRRRRRGVGGGNGDGGLAARVLSARPKPGSRRG
eukprot:scaffold124097_cov105-Phaeocystis_antarctica.AAC.1